jgi:hypothetical protein
MASAIRQLLDEISWEGNAAKYRGGGVGKENVLTVEVFQALDHLPRPHFLAPVLEGLTSVGASRREGLAAEAESMQLDVLPGDLVSAGSHVRVQPDVLLSSESSLVFVEAKAFKRASFQPTQLGRELLVTRDHSKGRRAVLMLVLGSAPPVAVRGHGRMPIEEAIALGAAELVERGLDGTSAGVDVCWTTWQSIAETVSISAVSFTNPDLSVVAAFRRQASILQAAINVHSQS